MKNIFLLFLCVFILTACTKFEIITEIKPKVYIVGNSVGIEYTLGDILVADELKYLSPEILQYFKKNKDNITIRLRVYYNEEVNTTCYFTYHLGGIEIAKNKDVVSTDLLMAKKHLISGFMMSGGDTKTKKTLKKETPRKIEKIQKESEPESDKDNYKKL